MAFKDFIWDKEEDYISWTKNGQLLKFKYKNMFYASLNIEQNIVYIEAGQNYEQDEIYYLLEDGSIHFAYIKKENLIIWQKNKLIKKIICENIKYSKYYAEDNIILVITLEGDLIGFDMNGSIIFKKKSPEGYTLIYLSTLNNSPVVICDGVNDKDSFGRNRWQFYINTETGTVTKANLTY
jgi:hypothetical protein